jgi:hypothetical protein
MTDPIKVLRYTFISRQRGDYITFFYILLHSKYRLTNELFKVAKGENFTI